jgi:hypothetical protein
MGVGPSFQLWAPAAAEARMAEAERRSLERRLTVPRGSAGAAP